ncbi:hypothetical protein [Paenibacillus solani]|uniref:hypothetical protein n=1 Tax=Paenibacillus solani TaxID=1705565 RepID=UPI003D2C20FC
MASNRARKSRTASKTRAPQQWVGQPVIVVLKDGSCYFGELTQIQDREVMISGLLANKKMPTSVAGSGDKAQISGFLSGLFGGPPSAPIAGAAAEGGAVAAPSGFGFLGQIVPHIKLGMDVIKTIMPLMAMFKI